MTLAKALSVCGIAQKQMNKMAVLAQIGTTKEFDEGSKIQFGQRNFCFKIFLKFLCSNKVYLFVALVHC